MAGQDERDGQQTEQAEDDGEGGMDRIAAAIRDSYHGGRV